LLYLIVNTICIGFSELKKNIYVLGIIFEFGIYGMIMKMWSILNEFEMDYIEIK